MGFYDYSTLEAIRIRDEVGCEYTALIFGIVREIYTFDWYMDIANPQELAKIVKQAIQHQTDLAAQREKTADLKISGLEYNLAQKDAKLKEYEETILWLQHALEGKK